MKKIFIRPLFIVLFSLPFSPALSSFPFSPIFSGSLLSPLFPFLPFSHSPNRLLKSQTQKPTKPTYLKQKTHKTFRFEHKTHNTHKTKNPSWQWRTNMAMEGANTTSSAVDLSDEDKLHRSLSLSISVGVSRVDWAGDPWSFLRQMKMRCWTNENEMREINLVRKSFQETHEASLDKWKWNLKFVIKKLPWTDEMREINN